MKNLFYSTMLVCIVLPSCKLFTSSPNGTYLVYKSETQSAGYPQYEEQLKKRFGSQQYNLIFADKYIQLLDVTNKDMIVLGKESTGATGTFYRYRTIEGTDSVAVTLELRLTQTDTILDVSTLLKHANHPFGGIALEDASIKCYLSKTK